MKITDILQSFLSLGDDRDIADKDHRGVTPSGNDKAPDDLYLPPLQQKQELLKKAVGVENVYDDGGPVEQHQADLQPSPDDESAATDVLDRIKRLSGIPVGAIQELSNGDVLDD